MAKLARHKAWVHAAPLNWFLESEIEKCAAEHEYNRKNNLLSRNLHSELLEYQVFKKNEPQLKHLLPGRWLTSNWLVGYFIIISNIAAKLLLSYYQNLKKKLQRKIFHCKRLKYTIIYGLRHISIKTVRSPSCACLKEPAASWWTSFDNGVNKMVIVMKAILLLGYWISNQVSS